MVRVSPDAAVVTTVGLVTLTWVFTASLRERRRLAAGNSPRTTGRRSRIPGRPGGLAGGHATDGTGAY